LLKNTEKYVSLCENTKAQITNSRRAKPTAIHNVIIIGSITSNPRRCHIIGRGLCKLWHVEDAAAAAAAAATGRSSWL